jgi:hypothetical protein
VKSSRKPSDEPTPSPSRGLAPSLTRDPATPCELAGDILDTVSDRHISWPILVLAILCLMPVARGVALLLSDSEGVQPLGWALVGFFGSGVVVLARKAVSGG